ncbi:MAG: M23 family metallopeptidase [Proteobacteria bacterium]|nr:M23 family metallopeptidase [Pseudomonadota bacterium]
MERISSVVAAAIVGLGVSSLVVPSHAADLRTGTVRASAKSESQSLLRFYNSGARAGTVTVALRDEASGMALGEWTSPVIPAGAEHQFSIATIEAELNKDGAGDLTKANSYAITVRTEITGSFQHLLYNGEDGALTNLSTCAAGVMTNPAAVSGVQAARHPTASSIVINNTGAAATPLTLGIYDARDGAKIGTAAFAPVAPGAQRVFSMAALEAAAGIIPSDGMTHYVVKLEDTFRGYLQHLVTNPQTGTVADMTVACAFNATISPNTQPDLRAGVVFSTAQPDSQSLLRFHNTGTTAGTVTVTLDDGASGKTLGEWTSPAIAPATERQFSIDSIAAGTGQHFSKPGFYGLRVQPGITGTFQHIVRRASALSNLSTCSSGAGVSRTKLSGVQSSLISDGNISFVVLHNTGATAAPVNLAIYDARDGQRRGTYATAAIASGGQATISVREIEAVIGAPPAGLYHYIIEAEAPFSGFVQHLVADSETGAVTDMTATCALGSAKAQATTYVQQAMFGGQCEAGQTGMIGFMLVCGSDNRFRYALPEDMPATPRGGYLERPAWYPPLRDVLLTSNPPSCPASGRIATMSTFIVPLDQLVLSTPQGAMLGDHVTPIDHAYIAIKALDKPAAQRTEADYIPVRAPADGEIIEISSLGAPWTNRIVIAHGCETYSIIMVLNRIAGVLTPYRAELAANGRVSTKISVRAGDIIGEQRDNPLDYSLHDGSRWLPGYMAPFSYAGSEAWKPYTVDPAPYFTPTITNAVQDVMRRVPAPRWGKIDHDVAGTAAGNWFLAGTVGYSGRSAESLRTATAPINGGPVEGKNTYAWSHLALAPYWNEPSKWVFSTGWWRDEKGDPQQWHLEVTRGKPTPPLLTPECGTVVYRLRQLVDFSQGSGGNTMIAGIVALRMNADETLTVEIVPGVEDPASFAGFSTARRTYRR